MLQLVETWDLPATTQGCRTGTTASQRPGMKGTWSKLAETPGHDMRTVKTEPHLWYPLVKILKCPELPYRRIPNLGKNWFRPILILVNYIKSAHAGNEIDLLQGYATWINVGGGLLVLYFCHKVIP